MFDIAWSELFVIIVVALVVVGPKDLPKLMRTAGQWAAKARAMADQFRRSFDDMARQSELEELRSEVNRLKHETTQAAAIESAMYSYSNPLPPTPTSNLEDVGAAPPKLDEPVPASGGPLGIGSPEAPAAAQDAPKIEQPATGTGG